MRTLWRLLAVSVFLTVQACTNLGPDYEEPTVEWLKQWETDLYGQAHDPAGEDEDLQFWWRALNDPLLGELIEIARRQNQSLRIAGLAILESQAILGIATGSQYPQVQQINGTWTRVDRWPTEGDDSGDHSDFHTYNAGFDIAWEMDFWGRFRRGVESADAAFFASISNQENAQVLLAAQVAEAYFAYLTVVQQIEIARENAALQKRSMEITESLYNSGQSAELDLQQARTQYLATEATIPNLEISLRQVENALGVLLGRAPGDLPELARAAEALPTLNPILVDAVPARLMMRRPDVRSAAWAVAAQSAQIGVAEANLYPSIALFGTIGWGSDNLDFTRDAISSGIGPTFAWDIFNYGRLKNNVRVQDARLQQAIEGYQLSVLAASREIDDAAISVVKTREQIELLRESLEAAERSLTLSTKRYKEGYSDFQRVLTAQRARATASSRFVVTQGAHINSVIAFYKSLGGGWQPATTGDILPDDVRQQMNERTDWDGILDEPLPQPRKREDRQ